MSRAAWEAADHPLAALLLFLLALPILAAVGAIYLVLWVGTTTGRALMSNRAKVRPNRLGVKARDVLYPMVCTPDTLLSAVAEGARRILDDTLPQDRLGAVDRRVYYGAAKAREVLDVIVRAGSGTVDYSGLFAEVARLEAIDPDVVVLVVSTCRVHAR